MRKKLEKKPQKKNSKFNIIWIYAAIALFFFGLQLFDFDNTKQTSWQEFNREMLQQKKVEKVVRPNRSIHLIKFTKMNDILCS